MSRITLDEKSIGVLGQVRERAEICDSKGAVIGYFRPVANRDSGARYVPNFTEEELLRFEQEPGGRTLDEIIRDFRKNK